jgi:hypothetical protein
MGQLITVEAMPGSSATTRIFSCNRSITGMAVERYPSVARATGMARPPDVLARRLFDLGATSVTVYSSDVTVEAPAELWPTLEPQVEHVIAHLFEYYGDDAGWSKDSLGAIGVEWIPPKEPAAE